LVKKKLLMTRSQNSKSIRNDFVVDGFVVFAFPCNSNEDFPIKIKLEDNIFTYMCGVRLGEIRILLDLDVVLITFEVTGYCLLILV
jgi:hypothetical protein